MECTKNDHSTTTPMSIQATSSKMFFMIRERNLCFERKTARVLVEWSSVLHVPRIISVRFKPRILENNPHLRTYVYAPTKQRRTISISHFLLQAFVNTVPNRGILLVRGTWMPTFGREIGYRENKIGSYGIGVINENCELFFHISLAKNNMGVTNWR